MVPLGNINSFTKGLDKSMADSSIHELEGKRGCLGAPWAGIRRQPDLPKDHPLAGLVKDKPLGTASQKVILGFCASGCGPGPPTVSSTSPPPTSHSEKTRTSTSSGESSSARLSPMGPAEGDRHRIHPVPDPRARLGWLA